MCSFYIMFLLLDFFLLTYCVLKIFSVLHVQIYLTGIAFTSIDLAEFNLSIINEHLCYFKFLHTT